MPHATETLTNGEQSSQFLSRLSNLPVVNDSIETFKSNPYGKKSIEIAEEAYSRFGKPVEPYFEGPYSYAKPYVQKADQLADSGLSQVEEHFPIVKEKTNTIIDTTKSYVFWPVTYLTDTYNSEYKKTADYRNRGPGLRTGVLAIVSTELKIASDFFQGVADFLGPKYQGAQEKGAEYLKQAEDSAESYAKRGQEKFDELLKTGEKKLDQGKHEATKAKDDVKDKAEQGKNEAKKAKDDVKEKANEATK